MVPYPLLNVIVMMDTLYHMMETLALNLKLAYILTVVNINKV